MFLGTRAAASLPAAAVLWAALIVAAPWADALPALGGATATVAAAVYGVGGLVCHQRPERSFHAHGAQWPVCARCTGLYLSGAAGILWVWLARGGRRRVGFHAWRAILAAAAVPTMVTLGVEWVDPSWTSGVVRAGAAVPLGAAAGVFLAESMSFRSKLPTCERMP